MDQPRTKIIHELKTLPQYFEPVRNGQKKFELRRNDRDFQVGDELLLKEYKLPITFVDGKCGQITPWRTIEGHYTGRELLVRVDYVMAADDVDKIIGNPANWRTSIGYVIMGVSLVG